MAIKDEFERGCELGWDEHFREAAAHFKVAEEDLWAIGSRETNLNPIYLEKKGDGGHGHGLMQIDDRSFKNWCWQKDPKNPAKFVWQNARMCILKGAEVLHLKRRVTAVLINRGRAVVHGKVYKIEQEPDLGQQRQIYIAAYNCGEGNSLKGWALSKNPDAFTTGKNYSKDVISRASEFKKLIEKKKKEEEDTLEPDVTT